MQSVENKTNKLSFIHLHLLILLLAGNCMVSYGQKSAYFIGADKLLIDANDTPYNQVRPGDTLYFSGGNRLYLNIRNFHGKSGSPIVMINRNGAVIIDTDHYFGISIENCRFIQFTGTGDPAQHYGFQVNRVANGSGLGIGYLSSDFEIDHISIKNTMIAGLYAKTDPNCSVTSTRASFTQYNTSIHDNYIAYTGNEGLYVGSSKYTGQIVNCNGRDTLLMPGLLDGVKIYNNTIKYAGWDGIQVGSASKNCQIFDNTILYDSQANVDTQMSGILIGGGTRCDCYNNFISQGNGDGIECLGLGGTRIYNNIIVDAGINYFPDNPAKMKYGIYVADTSVEKDSAFYLMHNNILHPKSDGIRFSSILSKGSFISSNVILMPGSYDYYEHGNTSFKGIDSYIMFQSKATVATVTNNYTERDAGSAGFESQKMDSPADFNLVKGSPLIDAVVYHPKTSVAFDFNHSPRPSGLKADIGAFEFQFVTSSDAISKATEPSLLLIQNPSINLVSFKLPMGSDSSIDLKIFNLNGELIQERRQFEKTADGAVIEANTSGWVDGIYLYTIYSDRQSYSGKFLKWQ